MNSLWFWSGLFFNILTNVGFKYGALVTDNNTKKMTIFCISLIFGLLNSYCFMEALKTIPLNKASAVFFSLTLVGMTLASYYIFHENLSWMRITGILVIIAGVVMINL